jgi:3'(2'), 5'-bisphosphate nucleotidase
LIEGTKPILGVVYLPATDALYFAARGFGAYGTQGRLLRELLKSSCADDPALMADRLLQVSERLPSVKPEQHAGRVLRFVHSSSHHSQEEEAFISNVKASFGALETVSAGSSLKFCLVAQGNADVYPRFGPTMEWDTAAGQCVVEEAGGRVDVIEGGPLPYNRQDLRNPTFIATGTRIQKESDSRDLIMKCVPVHS